MVAVSRWSAQGPPLKLPRVTLREVEKQKRKLREEEKCLQKRRKTIEEEEERVRNNLLEMSKLT